MLLVNITSRKTNIEYEIYITFFLKCSTKISYSQTIICNSSCAIYIPDLSLNFIAFILQELENCIGCMLKESNIKLQKHCADGENLREVGEGPLVNHHCVQCFCRPMWCLECMGRWFASRQDQQHPETWLSGKAPCPTCRAVFCMLDVCKIEHHP